MFRVSQNVSKDESVGLPESQETVISTSNKIQEILDERWVEIRMCTHDSSGGPVASLERGTSGGGRTFNRWGDGSRVRTG